MKMIKKILLNQTPLKINQKRLMFCLEKDGKSFWYRFTSNQFSPNEVYGFLPYKNELLLLTDKDILVNCGEFSDWEDRFVSDSIGKIKSIEVADDDTILAKTDLGVYLSKDAGKSWVKNNSKGNYQKVKFI